MFCTFLPWAMRRNVRKSILYWIPSTSNDIFASRNLRRFFSTTGEKSWKKWMRCPNFPTLADTLHDPLFVDKVVKAYVNSSGSQYVGPHLCRATVTPVYLNPLVLCCELQSFHYPNLKKFSGVTPLKALASHNTVSCRRCEGLTEGSHTK